MNASVVVTAGIPAISLAVMLAIGYGVWQAAAPTERARMTGLFALGTATWILFTFALAGTGLLARFDARPPPFLLLAVPTLGLPVWLGLSGVGSRLSRLPIAWIVGLSTFRLPLELVMHRAAVEGTMPNQMTFTGLNFDILSGASALVVALLAWRGAAPRWLLLAWNTLGSVLLLAIVVIAIASMPVFHAFGGGPERLNTWVAYAPFQLLPAALVTAAILDHVVMWRRLLQAHPNDDARWQLATGHSRVQTARRAGPSTVGK